MHGVDGGHMHGVVSGGHMHGVSRKLLGVLYVACALGFDLNSGEPQNTVAAGPHSILNFAAASVEALERESTEARRSICVESLRYVQPHFPGVSKLSEALRLLSRPSERHCANSYEPSLCTRALAEEQRGLMDSLDTSGLCGFGRTPTAVAWAGLSEMPFDWRRIYQKARLLNDLTVFEVRPSAIDGSGLFLTRPVARGVKLALTWWDLSWSDLSVQRHTSSRTRRHELAWMPQECHFLPGEAPGLDASIPISDQVASPVHLLSCFSRIINHACDSTVGTMFESGLPACPDPGGNGRNCVPREIQALSEKFGYSDITAVYLVATRDLTLDDEVVLNYGALPQYLRRPETTWKDAVCQEASGSW